MYRIAPMVISLMCFSSSFAQFDKNGEAFYIFDADWNPTKIEKAVYPTRIKKLSDTCFQFDDYNFNGPLIKSGQFKGQDGKTPHGKFATYGANGIIDSLCELANGVPHGDWLYFNEKGKIRLKKVFANGALVSSVPFDPNVERTPGADFEEGEAKFKGGIPGWVRFLNKNLTYPKRGLDLKAQGEVRIGFLVDADGRVLEPMIFKSVEFSMDDEARRVIKLSKYWVPAVDNGQPVRSYKIQPVVYRIP